VLQGVQPQISEVCSFRVTVDSEDATHLVSGASRGDGGGTPSGAAVPRNEDRRQS
jgi:hypothetical protein